MAEREQTYASFAAERGLTLLDAAEVGVLTPLLGESTAGGLLSPAARGRLGGAVEGVVGQLTYKRNGTFHFAVALAEIPTSTAFAPRLFCVRRGRRTRDDEFYGFEARHSKLWTESTRLNERYAVTTGPFQDPNWMRQLFSPALVDWLANEPPDDFSFELAYGSLLGSIEGKDPSPGELAGLCEATAHLATRIAAECAEGG